MSLGRKPNPYAASEQRREQIKDKRTKQKAEGISKPKMPIADFRGLKLAKRNKGVPTALSWIKKGYSLKQIAALADYAANVTSAKQFANFCRSHVEEMIGSGATVSIVDEIKSWQIIEKVADACPAQNSNIGKGRGTVYTIKNSLRNGEKSPHRPLSDRSKLKDMTGIVSVVVSGRLSFGCVSEIGGELFVWVESVSYTHLTLPTKA